MLNAQPSVSSGSGKHPGLTPPLLGSSCFFCCGAGFWVNRPQQLLTAELKLGTVAALFATVPRESPPETGQAVIAWPVFFLPAGGCPLRTTTTRDWLDLRNASYAAETSPIRNCLPTKQTARIRRMPQEDIAAVPSNLKSYPCTAGFT